MTLVSPDDPPVLIMHGTADGTLPLEQAERLYRELRAAGVPTEFVAVEGGTTRRRPSRPKALRSDHAPAVTVHGWRCRLYESARSAMQDG